MKKVLLLTHEYYPFKGGIARYVYNLFKSFNADEYLVATDHPEVQNSANIIHLRLKYGWSRPTWLPAFFKIFFMVRKHNIGLIFTPNILPLGSIAYFFHKFLGIPYVLSLHGLDIRLALNHKPDLSKNILAQSAYVLVNSQSTTQTVEALSFLGGKIKLYYPTVDLPGDYDPEKLGGLRKKYGLADDDKVLLTVARLNKRKGQDLVIKALADIGQPNLYYFIVGQGDFKAELLRLVRYYDLQNRVFFLDNVSDEQLIYYYKLADIFVLPNRHDDLEVEGLGIVFLEAAWARLPIIVAASGGVNEVWQDKQDALLIASENIAQLSEAIRLLLHNPQQAERLATAAWYKYQAWPRSEEQSKKFKELLSSIL